MGGGGTIEPEGANWGGAGWTGDSEEDYLRALEAAKAAAGLPSKPRAMVDGLVMGAAPAGDATPAPTPEGEALFSDLQSAGRAEKPGLLSRLAERLPVQLGGRAQPGPGPSISEVAREYVLPAFTGGVRPAAVPTAPVTPAVRPVPDVPPLASKAKPAARPRVELEAPPNFAMQVPPTPFADEGPLPADHPAVAKALEAARPRQGMPDLDSALQAGADRRLLAGLVRAGGTAIGRGRGPGYDALDAEADRPLAELALRRGEVQRVKSEEQAASDADPNSSQSAMARALVARALPGVEREPWFATASYARLASGPLSRLLDMNADLQRERIKASAKRGAGGAGVGLGKAGDAQLKELGEQYTKAGMPGFFQQYMEAKRVLDDPKYKDDLPGYGRLAGRLPDELVSDDGVALRQSLGAMLAEYRKGVTGAGMSDAERTEYGQITGLMQSGSDQSVRQGVERLNRAMQARAKAMGSGFRTDVSGEYGRREPSFAAAMGSTGAPTRGAGAPEKVRVSNGTETFEIDASDVAEAQRDGFQVVR